jgi:hypothetical protein
MALTEITYTGDGSDVTFGPIPFPYLEDSDVLITINGASTTAFTIDPSTKIITFSSAPANGSAIRVYRNTSDSELAASFVSGSAIRAIDLNDNFNQNLYIAQETNNNVANAVAGQIPDGSIGTSKLANLAVTNDKVANNILSSKSTFLQSGSGAVQRTVESKLQDVVSVKDFGAVGDGVTDDTAAIQAALNVAITANKPLHFGGGTFYTASQITYTVSAANRRINILLDGATIKCGALDVAQFDFDGSTFRPPFRFMGPGYVDGSALIINPGVASGSFLVIDRCDRVEIADVYFNAGTYGNGKGDSAIVPGSSGQVIISNCHFKGWDDHSIYFSGAAVASAQNLEDCTVTGCVFEDGGGAIRWARSAKNLMVSGNVFKNVSNAVIAAGGNTNWNPGNTITITGNLVDGCKSSAFDLRYFEEGVCIVGNSIYDTGSDSAGGAAAINLRGISRSVVSGNLISTKNPNNTPATDTYNAVGIYMTSATNNDLDPPDNTYLWQAQNNLIVGNFFHVLQVDTATGGRNAAIVDMKGDGTNHYINNKIVKGGTAIDYWVNDGGSNGFLGDPWIHHQSAVGYGIGTNVPEAPLHVIGNVRAGRKENTTQYLQQEVAASVNRLVSYSTASSANKLFINATTDGSNTTPTGGAVGLNLRVLNVDKVACNIDDVQLVVPLRLRSYATGSLPTSGILAGTIAYDSTTSTVKFYNGSVWANI